MSLPFLWLVPGELSLFIYHSPEYKELTFIEGRVEYTAKTPRYGNELVIVNNGNNKTYLRCHLKYTDSKFCPPFNVVNRKNDYIEKRITAAYDPKRSLIYELKSNGEKLMNYKTQNNLYQSQKTNSLPLGILVSCVFLVLAYIDYTKNQK